MDATTEDTKPVHRVKRAYAKKVSTKEANVRLHMKISREGADVDELKDSASEAVASILYMNAHAKAGIEYQNAKQYANRVWSGQSIDLPLSERKERVLRALAGQNLPTDGLIFTAEGVA